MSLRTLLYIAIPLLLAVPVIVQWFYVRTYRGKVDATAQSLMILNLILLALAGAFVAFQLLRGVSGS